MSRQSIEESSLDRRVLTQPTSPHSTEELSLDRSLRVVSIRFKLSMKTSPNPIDESSSRLFTSLLTVLGSNSWRPPWGMEKYIRGRLNWSPFCCHSTNELSLNRLFGHSLALITRCRSFSRHLTDESSLDRRVVT
ncbi:hypothetical protein YC2023_108007 [Brassica napus]